MVRMDHVTWDDAIINGLAFVEDHVLQVPLFLMTLMRYVTPTLDAMYVPSGRGQVVAWPVDNYPECPLLNVLTIPGSWIL